MFDFIKIQIIHVFEELWMNYEYSNIFMASHLILITAFIMYLVKKSFRLHFEKEYHETDIRTHNTLLFKIHKAAQKCMEHPKYIDICMKLLLNNPSAVNESVTYYGYTPFLVEYKRACMAGCKELILFMLEHGADINIHTINGDSPVYLVVHAIATGKIKSFEPLKILVDAGCSTSCKTNSKCTALHIAAFYGNNDLVRWLLLNGADPAPLSCSSPLEYAMKAGHFYTANLLTINVDDVE